MVKVFTHGHFVNIEDFIEDEPCAICGQSDYIICVDDAPHKELLGCENQIRKFGGIPVDYCIGPEIEWLIYQGVITTASCCGHKQDDPHCLIDEVSLDLVKRLGYETKWFNDGFWEIRLKTT